jgi:hypothetical protein
MMALAPLTVQNIPDCFRREPMTVLHPASITPGADEQVLSAEFGIAHALGVIVKVGGLNSDGVRNRLC